MKTLALAAILGVAIATTGAVSAHANAQFKDLARTGSIITPHGVFDSK